VRWLVTGATGFIGLTLAERLVARGEKVRALVRDAGRARELAGMGAEVVRGDVARPETFPEALAGVDVVVHLAGLVKAVTPEELFAVNAGGTRDLARAAVRAGRPRFVLVSSLAAAGPSRPGRPRTEEESPAPVSAYGESKLAAEDALRAVSGELEATVIRPPIVYGPRDREFLPALFRMARARVVVKAGFGDKRYSIVHVEDLVELVLAAAERGRRLERQGTAGIYFGDDGVEHTWEGLAHAALGALGKRGMVLPLPEALSWVAAGASTAAARLTGKAAILTLDKMMEIREAAWTCSSQRARRELAWRPRHSLVDGMRQSVKWYRERGLV
jgi:dihydroflavonol-4-reductase